MVGWQYSETAGRSKWRLWSGGGGGVLRNTEGGWLLSEGGGCGCVGGELGGAATTMWRRRQRIEKHGGRLADE